MRKGGCVCATSLPDTKAIKCLNTSISWMIIVHNSVPIHLLSVYVDPCNADNGSKAIENTKSIIESLFRSTRSPRLIIAGDFNQARPCLDVLAHKWGLKGVLPEGQPTHNKGGALDQVFTNLKITDVQQIQQDGRYSDHTPLACKLRFKRDSKDYDMKSNTYHRKQWQLRAAAASQHAIDQLLGQGKNTPEHRSKSSRVVGIAIKVNKEMV